MFTEAIEIVSTSAVADGQYVKLTCGKLDGDLYKRIDALFGRFRGKWVGGKKAAHLFPEPITGQVVIDSICAGIIPANNEYSLFPTQEPVIDSMMVELEAYCDDPEAAYRFLEPSAGTGAIAQRLRTAYPNATIDTIEIDPVNIRILQSQGFAPVGKDFLTYATDCQYDAVVMNPPFNGNEYVKHIEKATRLISTHGVVVTIAPASASFNDGALPLLNLINERTGTIEPLPEKSFKASGYSGDTLLVTIPGYVPDTIPYTGYASRKIAVLSVAVQCDFPTSEALGAFLRSHAEIALDAEGYPSKEFTEKVKRIYNGYMMANRLTYCVQMQDWEWRELAKGVAEYAELDYAIPTTRPAITPALVEVKPAHKPVDPMPKRQSVAPTHIEYTQVSLF